jgi:hypothetical protein
MLDPALWESRFTVIYNRGGRPVFDLRRQLTSRLTRIDITTTQPLKATWNKGGDLVRLVDRFQVGRPRYIPWGSSYQIWPADGFYPYQFQWRPVPWFPVGKIQFWEYTGTLTHADLVQLAQVSGDTDTLLSLVLEANSMIINPPAQTSTQQTFVFLPTDAVSRQMAAANADRNGGFIYNKTTKNLYVGYGVTAEKSSPNKIAPGGQMDIPEGFVGVINGIFEAVDLAPSSKAQIIEMIAA